MSAADHHRQAQGRDPGGRRSPGPAHPVRRSVADPGADAELVARVRRGDQDAVADVFDRYGGACYGLARRICRDEQLAHDVVQEAFVGFWRQAAGFDPARGSLSTWLLTMTHHKAVDLVRRESTVQRRRAAPDALDALSDPAPGPEAAAADAWRSLRVRRALAGLPAAQREALVLAYYGGYTQREIAGLTGAPLGTVKTRMFAAMRRLRGDLEGVAHDVDGAVLPAGGPA